MTIAEMYWCNRCDKDISGAEADFDNIVIQRVYKAVYPQPGYNELDQVNIYPKCKDCGMVLIEIKK